jgi:hypothetical protein
MTDPLDDEAVVLRALRRATKTDFRMVTGHRTLSVFESKRTTLPQLLTFVPHATHAAALRVGAVRALRVPQPWPSLDVVWEKLVMPDGSDDRRPGAAGHAGIIDLTTKPVERVWRDLLVDLANRDVRTIR